MSEMPQDFHSEEELVDWFESADLSQYRLDEALDVVVETHVKLALEEPFEDAAESTQGATGAARFDLVVTHS
jgi:hypothetical protein